MTPEPETTPEPAVVLSRDDRVLEITLNRPDAMNAINGEITKGLTEAFALLNEDAGLTVGILTGRGRGFCSGMDLKAFAKEGAPKGLRRVLRDGAQKPLVAAIEGFALAGGLELALTCDLIVAAKGTKVGLPECGVGLVATGGGLLRLAERLPQSLALELALTAEYITADVAFEYGLVNRLVEPGETLDAARTLAARIARNAPLAVTATKHLVRASAGRTNEEFWDYQAPIASAAFASADAKEGARAFAEKRPPVWTGS
jgi:enoyl-CoA hydratase